MSDSLDMEAITQLGLVSSDIDDLVPPQFHHSVRPMAYNLARSDMYLWPQLVTGRALPPKPSASCIFFVFFWIDIDR